MAAAAAPWPDTTLPLVSIRPLRRPCRLRHRCAAPAIAVDEGSQPFHTVGDTVGLKLKSEDGYGNPTQRPLPVPPQPHSSLSLLGYCLLAIVLNVSTSRPWRSSITGAEARRSSKVRHDGR